MLEREGGREGRREGGGGKEGGRKDGGREKGKMTHSLSCTISPIITLGPLTNGAHLLNIQCHM